MAGPCTAAASSLEWRIPGEGLAMAEDWLNVHFPKKAITAATANVTNSKSIALPE
jgi:hypothetical protein